MNLLFDLDGTLTDSAEGIVNSIESALRRLGHPPPDRELVASRIGPPIREMFTELIGHEAQSDEAVRLFRERYATVGLFENRVYSDIPELLDALAGHALFVATGKATVYAARILEHFGLHGHFGGIYGAELDGTRADKRELVRYILDRHALDPDATVMIGDTQSDIRAGRANGLLTVGVTWGYGADLSGAHHVADHPHALHKLIGSL